MCWAPGAVAGMESLTGVYLCPRGLVVGSVSSRTHAARTHSCSSGRASQKIPWDMNSDTIAHP